MVTICYSPLILHLLSISNITSAYDPPCKAQTSCAEFWNRHASSSIWISGSHQPSWTTQTFFPSLYFLILCIRVRYSDFCSCVLRGLSVLFNIMLLSFVLYSFTFPLVLGDPGRHGGSQSVWPVFGRIMLSRPALGSCRARWSAPHRSGRHCPMSSWQPWKY